VAPRDVALRPSGPGPSGGRAPEFVPGQAVRARVTLFGDGVSGGEVAALVDLGQRLQSSAVAGATPIRLARTGAGRLAASVISAVLWLARAGMLWRPSSAESDAGLIGRVGGCPGSR
jgi:hypothetical protein